MMKPAIKPMGDGGREPRLADEAETAEYIGDLVTQLERLARMHGLVKLQYLLSVCREEASAICAAGKTG